MFEILDRQTKLTGNQKKIIAAAVIGDALEFFDYFLIGFDRVKDPAVIEGHRHPRRVVRLRLARIALSLRNQSGLV